ncbi:MAG TPA: YbaB/EbfC family nucleoid-associated protein [Candidatus Lambdaproteobacteria bacterium]|jgi:DNA-binding YbaB/EbfC family protein|uniref:Nucleoid-associated protein DSY97_01515 n=1 Tax=SAR324 cluster bacterium TaxID=2024889 RepID=A0A432GBY1_9DELT|nr:YbaB/EbfC family nucleoid-associated protein [SAR324 cluster bacterium]RTZ81192.1 MAG: YbaB/EbfC family nucleoid-associated protein [SAR324 cluster bacterium]HCB32655.1 nucleoid-associated protein, YbaB/EbfC family [Deltaproteobacteria bacterium]HIA34106.1 YbaB/EbfC family nucleoid-associated protein [Candidatus Lambdaproteobacteria bacterium]HIN01008.1 YbaB/EbfC family nucleoid-associated protein [Deltaproteobacteria bacterium]
MIDMNEMMKKAQELSETMKQQQEELAKQIFSVSVGGEMVKMTFNGKQEAISIEIDPEVVDADDIETLQDLILSAVNEGLRQSQQNMQNSLGQQIGKMTGGLDLSSILNPKS